MQQIMGGADGGGMRGRGRLSALQKSFLEVTTTNSHAILALEGWGGVDYVRQRGEAVPDTRMKASKLERRDRRVAEEVGGGRS